MNTSGNNGVALPIAFNELDVRLIGEPFTYKWRLTPMDIPTEQIIQGYNNGFGIISITDTIVRAEQYYSNDNWSEPTLTVYYR